MVICRFFMQGNCRYGNNCYNEHPSGGSQGYSVTAQRQLFGGGGGGGGGRNQNQRVSFRDSYGANQNPYKWVSQDAQQQQNKAAPQIAAMSATDIVKGLAGEVTQNWEGGKMWPFTCLGFDKELPSLPGFTDMSYEELRYEAYESMKQGSLDMYVQRVQTLYQELDQRRQELKNPSMTLKQKLISFIEDCRKKKQSSSENTSLFSDSNNLFGSSSSSQPSSGLFGNENQNQSATFGQLPSNQSTFGQPGNQSLFGQTASQSLFGKSPQTASQPFGQTSQSGGGFGSPVAGNQTSVFGQIVGQPSDASQTPKVSLFGKPADFGTPQASAASSGASLISNPTQNSFGQSPVVPSGSTFGVVPVAPQSSAGGASTGASSAGGSTLYTAADQLTPEELQQFSANTFTVGGIPTRPPPKELCF